MKYEQTVAAVNAVIQQYQMNLTLRQIYYRLVAGGLIPNRRTSYNGLSAQLVTAREKGDVDESRIVDRSRTINDNSFDSPEQFLSTCEYTARTQFMKRFWASQGKYVEIWVEKDALSQVLSEAIRAFNTVVCPSRGYSSFSYLKEAANRFDRQTRDLDAAQVVILHFTDHDPSGIDMSRDLQSRFRSYSSADVKVRRIALTDEQVEEFNLIPNPTKLSDSRSPAYEARFGNECWELDAIPPDDLVRIVQDAIEEERTDPEAWDEVVAQEAEIKNDIRKALATMRAKYEGGK
jgi:hypothetical protein